MPTPETMCECKHHQVFHRDREGQPVGACMVCPDGTCCHFRPIAPCVCGHHRRMHACGPISRPGTIRNSLWSMSGCMRCGCDHYDPEPQDGQ